MLAPLLVFLAAGWEDPKPEGDLPWVNVISCVPPCRRRDEIMTGVAVFQPGFQRCYEKALRRRPDLEGRVTLRFTIKEDGSVSGARILASTLGYLKLEACLAEAAEAASFEPRSGCRLDIIYPFAFSIAE